VHTHEEHQLYVNRWLAVDEDDHQIIRELAVPRLPPADTLPGMTTRLLAVSSFQFASIKLRITTGFHCTATSIGTNLIHGKSTVFHVFHGGFLKVQIYGTLMDRVREIHRNFTGPISVLYECKLIIY